MSGALPVPATQTANRLKTRLCGSHDPAVPACVSGQHLHRHMRRVCAAGRFGLRAVVRLCYRALLSNKVLSDLSILGRYKSHCKCIEMDATSLRVATSAQQKPAIAGSAGAHGNSTKPHARHMVVAPAGSLGSAATQNACRSSISSGLLVELNVSGRTWHLAPTSSSPAHIARVSTAYE